MMFSNFMNYSLFKRMVTKDQARIMRTVISNNREELLENKFNRQGGNTPVAEAK